MSIGIFGPLRHISKQQSFTCPLEVCRRQEEEDRWTGPVEVSGIRCMTKKKLSFEAFWMILDGNLTANS